MDFKDYYKILGVADDADGKTIKAAYRKLARKYHPDINKASDAEENFKAVAEAYEVLKNKEKRAEYDQLKKYGGGHGFTPPPEGEQQGFYRSSTGGGGDFSDFFDSIFRESQQRQAPQKGPDIETELPIFLEDTLSTSPKTISLNMPFIDAEGFQQVRKKTLSVKIPKGVSEGERIRLKGQGGEMQGVSEKGDLYLTIKFVPHPVFDVKGSDLEVVVPVYPFEAALGAKVLVPTLDGKIHISIPPVTQSGAKLRVKGKGLPLKTGRADLFAIINVVMPKTVSEKDKGLWQQMAENHSENPRSEWETQS